MQDNYNRDNYNQQMSQNQYQTNNYQAPNKVIPEYAPSVQLKVLTYDELSNNVISQEQLPVLALQIEQQCVKGKEDQWLQNFEAITAMRTINKQYPVFVNQLFEKFGQQLMSFTDEVKPFILRNTIYLITEVVRNGRQVALHDNILRMFIPKIALKSQIAESKMIKEDCLVCVSEFVQNCISDVSLQVVLDLCSEKYKNPSLQIFALRMLAKQLESLGLNLKNLQQDTLQSLILTLSHALGYKQRLDLQNFSFQICMFIYNLLGQDHFLMLVRAFLQQNQSDELIQTLQQKNEKFNKRCSAGGAGENSSVRKSIKRNNKENTNKPQFCPQQCVQPSSQKTQFWIDGSTQDQQEYSPQQDQQTCHSQYPQSQYPQSQYPQSQYPQSQYPQSQYSQSQYTNPQIQFNNNY